MRRFLTIICALTAMCCVAQGQSVTITKGTAGKMLDEESVQNGWYLGRHGNDDCWLTRTEDGPKSFVRSDDWQLVLLDRNLNVHGRLELPMSRNCKVLAARNLGHYAGVIMVDSSEARTLTLVKFEVELDSMRLVGGKVDTLAQYEKEPTDRCFVWGAVSENDEYVGVLTLIQMTKKRQYVAVATMYGSELEELWRKEFAVGTTNSIAVTNEGEMVTLGFEEGNAEQLFTINVITRKTGDTYGLKMNCDRVKDMQILNVLGRKVLCAGLFSPLTTDPRDNMVGGTVSMAFDLDSTKLTSFVVRPFQNEDMNILLNKKTKKVQHSQQAPMVVPLAWTPMPYGAVLAVGHRHTMHYVNANGTIETSYFAQGIHLVALDEDGHVKWARNVRRNDMQKHADEKLFVALFPMGDTVCLLKSEHPKYPATYDIAKDVKELEMGDKNNLVMYALTESGEVKKTVLEQKTKHSLVSAAKRGDSEVVMLTLDGSKSRMVEMKIEK